MTARLAPGVYVNEYTFNQYVSVLGLSTLAVVGGATKGPLNTPTLVLNEADLVRAFGPPLTTDYALQAAVVFLRKGRRLLFTRIANGDETADLVVRGAKRGTGTITFSAQPADGNQVEISDGVNVGKYEFDDDGSVTPLYTAVTIGVTPQATMANLVAAINATLFTGTPLEVVATDLSQGTANANCKLTTYLGNTPTRDRNVAVIRLGTNITVTGITGATLTGQSLVTFEATSPGTWGNAIKIEVRVSNDIGAKTWERDIFVWAQDTSAAPYRIVERFNRLSLDSASSRYIETVLSEGIPNEYRPSNFIRADVTTGAALGVMDALAATALGSAGNQIGADGISALVADDYVGTVTGQQATGLKCLRNPEKTEFNLLAVPGISHTEVIAEMLRIAGLRGDCFVTIDPPMGVPLTDPGGSDDVINWHNGTSALPNAPTAALDNSRAHVCWPWVKDYDPYNGVNLWLPPSGFWCAAAAKVDDSVGVQYAVAGLVRGKIDGDAVEYSCDQDDIGLLIVPPNAVNPVVDMAAGLVVWGDRTLLRTKGPLQFTNVRRMITFAEKVIATAARYLNFDPNNATTWTQLRVMVNPVLAQLAKNNGLEKFFVACDETTNPSAQRAEGIMAAELHLIPVPPAESIILNFNIYESGAEFAE